MGDAFGYESTGAHEIVGVKFAEGKHDETLQPAVILEVKLFNGEEYRYAMTPDMADIIVEGLTWGATRAREKHWE